MSSQNQTSLNDNVTNYRIIKSKLKNIQTLLSAQAIASAGIFVIISFYVLYAIREIAIPILIAFLLYVLLHPLVRSLKKLHIPSPLGAFLIILTLFLIICYGFYSLSYQAKNWLDMLPNVFSIINQKLTTLVSFLEKPLEIFSKIKEQIDSLINLTANQNIQQVKVAQSYFVSVLFSNTWGFFVEFSMSFILLFFLLASEDFYYKKIIIFFAKIGRKKEVANIAILTEQQIWTYLFSRTMINIGLAIVVSLLMYFLDMPNPILWGVMTGILEYIPFLGALVSTIILIIVSIISFENVWHIILVPLTFFIVLIIEGNFITPYIFGRSLTLNTISVILSVLFFGWIWGIIGAFIAVPMLVITKIFLDNFYKNNIVSVLLSDS